MTDEGILLIVGALLFIFIALPIALWLITRTLFGAAFLFAYAGEQGFIGFAVYIACWVFMFPVMLIVSLIVGILNNRKNA